MKNFKKLILMNVVSLIVFILISIGVKFTKLFTNLDLYVSSMFSSVTSSFLIMFSKNIHFIFDTTSMVVISIIISIFLLIKHSRKNAAFLSITMLADALILLILKLLLEIPRPISNFITETDFSFPSGHATTTVVFFGILSYLIINKYKNVNFEIALASFFMVLLISFTRLYLGIHWFSDVLGGIFLGEFILTGSLIIKHVLENGRS
ncbi:phosphatase PAP2 family protein [Candidatus Woesearchaeota archaeon]|nr:phosphatase PAP2 family protein [Candidatus Woesearchaeota archaeon]